MPAHAERSELGRVLGGVTIDASGNWVYPGTRSVDVNGGVLLNKVSATCKVLAPIGLHAANTSSVTTLASRELHFLHVGRLLYPITSAILRCEVTTAYVAGNFAAVGLYSSVPVAGTATTLTLLGEISVETTFNSTGLKNTTITATAAAGTDLWVAYGQRGGTQFQLRALLADVMQQGVFQVATLGMSSVDLGTSWTGTLASTTEPPAWVSLWT